MKQEQRNATGKIGRIILNNIKSFAAQVSIAVPEPFMITTTCKRIDNPSKLEEKLFSPRNIFTGEKIEFDEGEFIYDHHKRKDTGDKVGYALGEIVHLGIQAATSIYLVAAPLAYVTLSRFGSPNAENIKYWWIPHAILTATNLIDTLREKKYIKEKCGKSKKIGGYYPDF